MHRTLSLDVGVIMTGSVILEMESGEQTTLKEGDTHTVAPWRTVHGFVRDCWYVHVFAERFRTLEP